MGVMSNVYISNKVRYKISELESYLKNELNFSKEGLLASEVTG